MFLSPRLFFFFFNDTATTEIYTLSLHDALPISRSAVGGVNRGYDAGVSAIEMANLMKRLPGLSKHRPSRKRDRKSTRLNSSHDQISYAVFCLKKKKKKHSKQSPRVS